MFTKQCTDRCKICTPLQCYLLDILFVKIIKIGWFSTKIFKSKIIDVFRDMVYNFPLFYTAVLYFVDTLAAELIHFRSVHNLPTILPISFITLAQIRLIRNIIRYRSVRTLRHFDHINDCDNSSPAAAAAVFGSNDRCPVAFPGLVMVAATIEFPRGCISLKAGLLVRSIDRWSI